MSFSLLKMTVYCSLFLTIWWENHSKSERERERRGLWEKRKHLFLCLPFPISPLSLLKMPLAPKSRADAPKSQYRMSADGEGARRKREDAIVQIPKPKRDINLPRKCREINAHMNIGCHPGSPFGKKSKNPPAIVNGLGSEDISVKHAVLVRIRKRLAREHNPPIDCVVSDGLVPRLVEFLKSDIPHLQFEAAWCLTNIVAGTSEHTKTVIDHGALPVFVQLLASMNDDVREQAVWALGNIAGDSPAHRDLVLSHGAMEYVLALLTGEVRISMIRNATWTLLNFCRGKPKPPFDQVKIALPCLNSLIHIPDDAVLSNACWALSYLSDGPKCRFVIESGVCQTLVGPWIQAVIESGVCQELVKLLWHPAFFVRFPALRAVGNIVMGDDVQTQVIIDAQALPRLASLLMPDQKKDIKKEACWTISNITAGNTDQIQAVINANIIPLLLYLLANAEFKVKKEAAWAVSNVTFSGNNDQIKYLVGQGSIRLLCDLLNCPDPRTIRVCLEGLEQILRVGEAEKNMGNTAGVNMYAQLVYEAEGLEKIENLQTHKNAEVYEKSVKILEMYFGFN